MASWVMMVFSLLDLSAFLLAVAAESTRSTVTVRVDDDFNYNYCVYGSNIATVYGICAVLLLMASQILKMVPTQCFSKIKGLTNGASRAWASFLFITCWMTFLAAEVCLVIGLVSNSERTKYRTIFRTDPPVCQSSKKGVFASAAGLIFVTGSVSDIYYLCYLRSTVSTKLDVCDTNEAEDLKKSLVLEP